MAADTFLNWPYPRLRLMERTLPRDTYREDKPIIIQGNPWAGPRSFQESRIYGEQLFRLTQVKAFASIRTWEARVEGHPPLQAFIGVDDKCPTRQYFSVYADTTEVNPILANLYGYCPFSLDGLIEQGNLRAKTTGLDKAAVIEQAYGLKARQWYEQHSKSPIPAVSYLGDALWPDVEYCDTYVDLDDVLFVLSAYKLVAHGKLDIKLPHKRVSLSVRDGELGCEYIDEKGQRYPTPVPSYVNGKLNEATVALIRTGTELQKHRNLRSSIQDLVNTSVLEAQNTAEPKVSMDEWLSTMLNDTLNEVAELLQKSGYKHLVSDNLAKLGTDPDDGTVKGLLEINRRLGAELWDTVVETRKAFLSAYLAVTSELGRNLEERIAQAIRLNQAEQTRIQVVAKFEPYRDQFTRTPSSQEMNGYYKFFQPMPAGLGSQWRMRRNDRTGQPMEFVANEQLSLLDANTNAPAFNELNGHKALIDLRGHTEDSPICRAASLVFNPATNGNLALSLLPRTLSAVMYKLHEHTGGDLHQAIRVTAREVLEFMNPRMAKGAHTQTFGKGVDAYEVLDAALQILQAIKYRRDDKKGQSFDQINGLISIFREGKDNYGRPYYGIQLQPELVKVMQGQSRDMRYMNHNFEIMRSYSGKEVWLNPVAQLALETLACINVRNTGKQELLTPNGTPWTVEALNNHLGIQKGSESMPNYIKKFLTVLDTQTDRGTLKEWRVDGRMLSGSDFGKTRIVPVFSDALYHANMQSRTEQEVRKAQDALTKPVAKKGQALHKRTYTPADTTTKPRGRPRKAGD